MLNNLRIVLVETSHAGNIGAAARAMKTMGLSRLYLISPHCFPSEVATARASGAADILENAIVCDDLATALADTHIAIGCSARERSLAKISRSAREHATRCCAHIYNDNACQIAMVFGNERSGLSNAQVDLCTELLQIPCNHEYSSLNLGAAVQILCYELRQAYLNYGDSAYKPKSATAADMPASVGDFKHFLQHQQQVLAELGFFGSHNPEIVLRRLQNLYQRALPSTRELNILRGIFSSISNHIQKNQE